MLYTPARIFVLLLLSGSGLAQDDLIHQLPSTFIPCHLGNKFAETDTQNTGFACVLENLAKAGQTIEEVQLLKVPENSKVTLDCMPVGNRTVEFWSDNGRFYSPGEQPEWEFSNGTLKYEVRYRWAWNEKIVRISTSCARDEVGLNCAARRNTRHGLEIRKAHPTQNGTYACVIVDECRLRETTGQCRLQLGKVYKLVVLSDGSTSSTWTTKALTTPTTSSRPIDNTTGTENATVDASRTPAAGTSLSPWQTETPVTPTVSGRPIETTIGTENYTVDVSSTAAAAQSLNSSSTDTVTVLRNASDIPDSHHTLPQNNESRLGLLKISLTIDDPQSVVVGAKQSSILPLPYQTTQSPGNGSSKPPVVSFSALLIGCCLYICIG